MPSPDPRPDLDHTSFAVPDALAWARHLRRELGAAPVTGETQAEFRWLSLYVGDEDAGARIELIEPQGPGFLTRFLDRHGIGPHHLTFTVPELRTAVQQARTSGWTVVGESYADPGWREAFLVPDAVHGVVIQLAETDETYQTADDPWWEPVWDTTPARTSRLGATYVDSTDLARSRLLFGDLLGATVHEDQQGLRCSWPSGEVVVSKAERGCVSGMDLRHGPLGGLEIGPCLLGDRDARVRED